MRSLTKYDRTSDAVHLLDSQLAWRPTYRRLALEGRVPGRLGSLIEAKPAERGLNVALERFRDRVWWSRSYSFLSVGYTAEQSTRPDKGPA
jgi:hypothetical protein